jgi:hypothetical protein
MVRLWGTDYTRAELMKRSGSMDQFGGIRMVELTEGPGRGVRVAEIRTGSGLEMSVLVDRCLDLSYGAFRGIPLCWRSCTGDVHPSFYEPEGLSWLRTFFGGVLATCGLTTAGAPCTDGEDALGLHGRIGATMADKVAVHEGWAGDDYVMSVEGEVREAAVYGPNLSLHRRVSTRLGSSSILLEDTIENRGHYTQPLMILYHFNIGWPIVSERSRLVAPIVGTRPRDDIAAKGIDGWSTFQPPTHGYEEQCFYHEFATDSTGRTFAAILNDSIEVGVVVRFRPEELPCFTQWKMVNEGVYVCGLEPANCRVTGRANAREADELQFIEPGEVRENTVEFSVVRDSDLSALRSEAAKLTGA